MHQTMSETCKPNVLILGTCDTKLSELLYLRTHIIAPGANARLTDLGGYSVLHENIDDSNGKFSHIWISQLISPQWIVAKSIK